MFMAQLVRLRRLRWAGHGVPHIVHEVMFSRVDAKRRGPLSQFPPPSCHEAAPLKLAIGVWGSAVSSPHRLQSHFAALYVRKTHLVAALISVFAPQSKHQSRSNWQVNLYGIFRFENCVPRPKVCGPVLSAEHLEYA